MKEWFIEHADKPYLMRKSLIEICKKTQLDKKQISNWFMNVRKRIWQPIMLKKKNEGKYFHFIFLMFLDIDMAQLIKQIEKKLDYYQKSDEYE